MKSLSLSTVVLLCAGSFAAGLLQAGKLEPRQLESRIFKLQDARVSQGEWGDIRIYTEDGTPSSGTASVLTATLTFLPGKQLQPPHQHPEEEFQYIIEGEGTWSLNGQDHPLAAGDLMYSKPGDWHGLRNSGEKPLRFVVFKWLAKD